MIGALVSLENHYQNAYVTRDLDASIEAFRALYELRTRVGMTPERWLQLGGPGE